MKIDAIINLEPPQNLTELRSFIGCVNQMRNFMPDFSHSMSNLQKLLKKGVPYIWDNTMQQDFDQIKDMLKSPLGLKSFNRDWNTVLYTDFSGKGLGFCLTQENPENTEEKHIIYCDSTSLMKKQEKLPAIYGENLAIIFALNKCKYFLHGCKRFKIRTDQQALAQIYNKKQFDELSEEISDIVVATAKFHFNVEYVPGKTNIIADFLSRNPLWDRDTGQGPLVTDDFGRTFPLQAHIHSAQLLNKYKDRILSDLLHK